MKIRSAKARLVSILFVFVCILGVVLVMTTVSPFPIRLINPTNHRNASRTAMDHDIKEPELTGAWDVNEIPDDVFDDEKTNVVSSDAIVRNTSTDHLC